MYKNLPGKLIDDNIKAWFDPTNDQQCFTDEEIVEVVNKEYFLQLKRNTCTGARIIPHAAFWCTGDKDDATTSDIS